MSEEARKASEELERSAFGLVLARLMRSRGMTVDAETVEWLSDGTGLTPEDLMGRMANETSEHIGSLEGLRDGLKLNKSEEIELALAYALEIEDGGESGAPRCRMDSKTDKPCWREAAVPRYADEDELTLCTEYARVVELHDDVEGLHMNLQTIEAWIRGPVVEARNET